MDTKNNTKLYIVLAIFFGLSFLAAITQSETKKPETAETNNTVVTQENLVSHIENFVFFYTKTFDNRTKTRVVVPFSYKTEVAPILYIGFAPEKTAERIGYLFSHPQLNSLDWESVKSGKLNLYQRSKTYKTVEDFLNNPPELTKIVVDDLISKEYEKFKGTTNTENEFDLEKFDYILTTFVPHTQQDGVTYYENIIDASDAVLNQNGEIEWFIRHPQASEDKPYLLGQIHIDYMQ